ncbi:hypothetical protein [Pectobacterium polaris]|nr:hypothetical protein [Pectobacterium polaris]MBN3215500.1 hypothetical protein [Pectobacterium polaris]
MPLAQQGKQWPAALPFGSECIASPANTSKQEATMSKERRHIIGNQEA